jgi:DNA-binding CsgD family transcriptional regulator
VDGVGEAQAAALAGCAGGGIDAEQKDDASAVLGAAAALRSNRTHAGRALDRQYMSAQPAATELHHRILMMTACVDTGTAHAQLAAIVSVKLLQQHLIEPGPHAALCRITEQHVMRDEKHFLAEAETFEEGRMAAALVPGARFLPLETRNHILLEGEPSWTQFMQAIEEFLPASRNETAYCLTELTPRERDLLEFVAQGSNNNEIAARLNISVKTVRNHLSTIFSKLGASTRAQVIVQARDAGFGRRR